jgi:hypothetical protein
MSLYCLRHRSFAGPATEDYLMSDEYQDHLFDSTIAYDDSPDVLAAYIEGGGDLDEGMRNHLASLIRLHFPKPCGGKKTRSDVDFYMFVREWCLQETFSRVARKFECKTGQAPTPLQVIDAFAELSEDITTEDGLKHVIDTGAFGVSPDAEIGGLRKKYNRGKALVRGK